MYRYIPPIAINVDSRKFIYVYVKCSSPILLMWAYAAKTNFYDHPLPLSHIPTYVGIFLYLSLRWPCYIDCLQSCEQCLITILLSLYLLYESSWFKFIRSIFLLKQSCQLSKHFYMPSKEGIFLWTFILMEF